MKLLPLSLLAVSLIFSPISHADQTPLTEDKFAFRGYIGPDFKISELNHKTNILMGAKGGWLINDRFLIGGIIYGTVDEVENTQESFGYAGVYVDYKFFNSSAVSYHLNLGLAAGALDDFDEDKDEDDESSDRERVLVLEPGLSAQFKIHRHARAELALSFRAVESLDHESISDNDLSSPTLGIGVVFGKF